MAAGLRGLALPWLWVLVLSGLAGSEDVPWCAPLPGHSYGNQVLLVAARCG